MFSLFIMLLHLSHQPTVIEYDKARPACEDVVEPKASG